MGMKLGFFLGGGGGGAKKKVFGGGGGGVHKIMFLGVSHALR